MPAATPSECRVRLGWIATCVVLGCGPDIRAHAQLDRICGEEGPTRILEFDPDDLPDQVVAPPPVGQRRIVTLRFDEPASEETFGSTRRIEIWSTGLCGENPIRLRDGKENVVTFGKTWPDRRFTCDDAVGDVFTLDPEGVHPPQLLFRIERCQGWQTPHGLVALADNASGSADLVLYTLPDDPWTQPAVRHVLVESVRTQTDIPTLFPEVEQVVSAGVDVAFAITTADELVSVHLPDGGITVEATDVRELAASPSGRFLDWRTRPPTSDNPDFPGGAVYVRDRDTGRTEHLTDASLGALALSLEHADDGVIVLELGYAQRDPTRFWRWPTLEVYDLDPDQWVAGALDEHRYLVRDSLGLGPYAILDLDTRDVRTLGVLQGTYRRLGDHASVFDIIEIPCCDDDDLARLEGALWRGSAAGDLRQLASRVTLSYAYLSDGDVLTNVDVGTDELGTLVVVDPDTQDEQTIDDDVVARFASVDPDDTIVYAVVDGERTGLWATRLAP